MLCLLHVGVRYLGLKKKAVPRRRCNIAKLKANRVKTIHLQVNVFASTCYSMYCSHSRPTVGCTKRMYTARYICLHRALRIGYVTLTALRNRYIYIYTYMHTHIYIYIYMHTHIYTHTHIYACIYIYTHTHTYIYICTHIYIHIHTHIYIYICTHIYI